MRELGARQCGAAAARDEERCLPPVGPNAVRLEQFNVVVIKRLDLEM
jgi:hypothetical protein